MLHPISLAVNGMSKVEGCLIMMGTNLLYPELTNQNSLKTDGSYNSKLQDQESRHIQQTSIRITCSMQSRRHSHEFVPRRCGHVFTMGS